VSTGSALAPDAAMALGIASTAMPFARTPEDEAERWLRVLRTHGEAGVALHALGVSEGPLETSHGDAPERQRSAPTVDGAGGDRDAVALVTEQALDIASRRDAGCVGTLDLLMAVMRIYGEEFDRVLHAHGTDRGEVLERLAAAYRSAPTVT
jgi:hypothetical protein